MIMTIITYIHIKLLSMSVTTFQSSQSAEYQHHVSQVTTLTTTLTHQQNIQTYKTIPKPYQPRPLKTSDPSLAQQFTQEYHDLFFKHLEKVIMNNQIKLELHKSALTSIIVQTEMHISRLSLPAHEMKALYDSFLLENHIENRIPIPELQQHFKTTSPPKPKRKRGPRRKRKCPTPTPEAVKQRKPNHFLSPPPQEAWTPP